MTGRMMDTLVFQSIASSIPDVVGSPVWVMGETALPALFPGDLPYFNTESAVLFPGRIFSSDVGSIDVFVRGAGLVRTIYGNHPPVRLIPAGVDTPQSLLDTCDLSLCARGYSVTILVSTAVTWTLGPVVVDPRATPYGEPARLLHPVTSPMIDPVRTLERLARITRHYWLPLDTRTVRQLSHEIRRRAVTAKLCDTGRDSGERVRTGYGYVPGTGGRE